MDRIRALYEWLDTRREFAPLFIRLAVGFHLIYGTQDNVFDPARMVEFQGFLARFAFPSPVFAAHLSAYAQFICGILLIFGAATRLAALTMLINFAVALVMVHSVEGGYPGAALAVWMFSSALFFILFGAGRPSVDAWLSRRRHVRLEREGATGTTGARAVRGRGIVAAVHGALGPVLAAAVTLGGAACASPGADVAPRPPADPAKAESLVARANAALGAKRWDEGAALLREASPYAPDHPSILWYIGAADLARGDTAAAVRALAELARTGAAPSATRDTTLRALAARPDFAGVRDSLQANARPVVASDTAYLIADTDLVPESIARDPLTGRLYAGSLARGAIVVVQDDGSVSDFGALARRGVTQVLGIKIDSASRMLWANVKLREPAGAAALLRMRLDDGAVTGSYEVSGPGEQRHLLNDLDFGPRGEVYVTDSEGGAVFRLEPGATSLEPLPSTPALRLQYPNGVAVASDGSRLYVAHSWGIAVVDLASGRWRPLDAAPDVPLCCVDGLYAVDGQLLAVQSLLDVDRVALFTIRGDSAVAVRDLERQHPAYDFPTTGVVVGQTFLYVAGSQLRRVTPDGKLLPAAAPKRPLVLRLSLPGH